MMNRLAMIRLRCRYFAEAAEGANPEQTDAKEAQRRRLWHGCLIYRIVQDV